MSLKTRHISDLRAMVDAISRFKGVVGVLLFGSVARGDYDEYSDYDLLVIFEDKPSMWQCWDDLFMTTSTLGKNYHVIPETLEEFKRANPAFLEELSKYGKVLFARLPLEVFLRPVKLKASCLLFYDMAGLSYKEKMRALYALYRKGGGGAVAKAGGVKLNEGCILVPSEAAEEVMGILSDLGIKTKKLEIYINEEYFSGRKLTL